MPLRTGCIVDHGRTIAAMDSLHRAGAKPAFGDAHNSLLGYHKTVRKNFLRDSELTLFGQYEPSMNQARGTCVWRGSQRAIQTSMYRAITNGLAYAQPCHIAGELIYALARVEVGKGWLGSDDGASGADAARGIHDYGILAAGTYSGYDLTGDNEDLGVQLALPRHGVPAAIRPLLVKGTKVHWCADVEQIADALASDAAVFICSNTLWQSPNAPESTPRDGRGMCRPVGSGGHCESIVGFWFDDHGELCLERCQSWGGYPHGPDKITLEDGSQRTLPPGCYGAYASDVQRSLQQGGEAIAVFDVPVLKRPV